MEVKETFLAFLGRKYLTVGKQPIWQHSLRHIPICVTSLVI